MVGAEAGDIISESQLEVLRLLREFLPLGTEIQSEAYLSSILPVDLFLPFHNVVIEVDGYLHYLRDETSPTGRTLFSRRLLTGLGYRVFSLDVMKMQALDSEKRQSTKTEPLKQKLNSKAVRTEIQALAAACVDPTAAGTAEIWEEIRPSSKISSGYRTVGIQAPALKGAWTKKKK